MNKALTLLAALLLAQPLHAGEFATIYRAALDHDSVFAEATAKRQAAGEKVIQGRATLLPAVSLGGNFMQNREEIETRHSPTPASNGVREYDFNSHALTLSLTQPLFRWQNWVGYEQSKLVVAQAEAAFANARQDLILRTAQAYFDVLQARANLDAAEAYKAAVASQLQIAREAFRLGTGIKTDLFDAETRFASASTQLIASETELEVRRRLLENLSGPLSPAFSGAWAKARLSPPQPGDVAQWARSAEQGSLVVAQQQLALEIAEREVERQRAGHLPTVDLIASTGRNSTLSSGSRLETDADRIGVQVNLPIFQGGEVVSRTNEASANRRAAQSALETARRTANLSARQAYLGVVNGLAQIESARLGLEAARNAVTSNKDAFNVGVRLNIDVLNSQSQVFIAERELNRVLVETLIAQLKLKAAVGALGDDDVAALDGLLD